MEMLLWSAVGIILFIMFIIYVLFLWSIKKDILQKKQELLDEEHQNRSDSIVFAEGQEVLDYLDRLVKDKYTYHLYASFLPIYLDRKIPEKNIVNEIKSKIYVTTVGSLSKTIKTQILRYFTEKGIEIYINEKIMIYMNETDFKAAEKYSESFRDMKPDIMDKLI